MNVEDIWFKGQRVLRTIVQVGIPAFIAFAAVVPQIIEALGLPADSELRLWLIAVAAVITAVAAALSRVFAIPAVNRWLTRFGLGSVPASYAKVPVVKVPAEYVDELDSIAADADAANRERE